MATTRIQECEGRERKGKEKRRFKSGTGQFKKSNAIQSNAMGVEKIYSAQSAVRRPPSPGPVT
jgi:hypothetical protein